MFDISVIILTYNEELHIRRCLERLRPLEAERIVIIDSESTDGTCRIAREMGAEVVVHPWPGNQAAQFNWALDNLDIQTRWVLRLDADEYLSPELIEEIRLKMPSLSDDVAGVVFKRRHIFMGRWMKKGIYPVKLLRLFRNGVGKCEERLMDEHIVISDGRQIEFDNDFCDHNLNNLSWFCQKHINYAVREAAAMLAAEYNLSDGLCSEAEYELSGQASVKRNKKNRYSKLPLFFRSTAYFLYRYILKGAFLEGKEGFLFSFFQGWWYRTLVDAKILEIKRKSKGDPDAIKRILKEQYNIAL